MTKKRLFAEALAVCFVFVCSVALAQTQTPYDRGDWPHWSDLDRDCQNTRNEVLIAESSDPDAVLMDEDGCRVEGGLWVDPYTGLSFSSPRGLDVDHMVPLSWAHDHGAAEWSRETKQRYANSQRDPDHLVAVSLRENRQKGARGPDEWLPPDATSWCWYGLAWSRIVTEWDLSMSGREAAAVLALVAQCDAP